MARLRGLSLFANVGIAEAYLKDIGIDILVANEIDCERAKFYQHVYPNCHMICGDITDKKVFESIINECLEKRIDFVWAQHFFDSVLRHFKRSFVFIGR